MPRSAPHDMCSRSAIIFSLFVGCILISIMESVDKINVEVKENKNVLDLSFQKVLQKGVFLKASSRQSLDLRCSRSISRISR